jgi:hypothetical protein
MKIQHWWSKEDDWPPKKASSVKVATVEVSSDDDWNRGRYPFSRSEGCEVSYLPQSQSCGR